MTTTFPIQTNFSGGEISPRLHGRIDSELYARSLARARNFLITPQGSALKRPGTEFRILAFQDTDNNARLFTFEQALDNDIIVEVNGTRIRLVTQDGQVVNGLTANQVLNPDFLNDFTSWNVEFLRDTVPWDIIEGEPGVPDRDVKEIIRPNSAGPGLGVFIPQAFGVFEGSDWLDGWDSVEQQVSVLSGISTDFTCRLFSTKGFVPESNTVNDNLKGRLRITIGTASGLGDIFDQVVEPVDFNNFTDIDFNFTPAAGTVFLKFSTENIYTGITGQNLRRFTVNKISIIGENATPTLVEFTNPWPVEKLDLVQTEMDTAKGRLYFFQRDTEIHELFFDDVLEVWIFQPFPVTPPLEDDDITPSWSTTLGFPGVGAIFKGRLWVGSTNAALSTIWASEVWEYDNFLVPATVTDVSPLQFTLSTPGDLTWMIDLKNLLIGTNLAEVIGRSQGGQITASDFDFPSESTWGSGPVQPTKFGTTIFFTTASLNMIRSLYDGGDRRNGYVTQDVSFIAEHLFRKTKVVRIHYAKLTLYQVAFLLNDGTLAMCTFNEELQIQAFWVATVGDFIVDMTFANGLRGTSLWLIVRRDGVLYLEEVTLSDEFGFCLDQSILGNMDDATKIATGFEDFADREVTIIMGIPGDRFVTYQLLDENPFLVSATGTIQLPDHAEGFPIAGLGYVANMKTLIPETAGQRAGSSQSSLKHWSTIVVRLEESAIPFINGQRPPLRVAADPMSESPPLISDDVEVEDLDYDKGEITIIQDLPLRTEIVALFGKVATYNR